MTLPGDGALVQGWMAVNGVIDTNGPVTDLKVPAGTVMGAVASTTGSFVGNLPSDAAENTVKSLDLESTTRRATPGTSP